ncbi:MAG: virulence protein RhuM/Fic/DOC family protein [Idiomarina sp.]|nr:virulence protein RhuM/Fic/DOC family protein [Idiomarina sp.]
MNDKQVQIFESQDGQAQLEVALEENTVWLNQAQMSLLFDTSSDNIGLHLKNIYRSGELEEIATTEDFSVVRKDVEGYTLNQRRLQERGIEFEQALNLLSRTLSNQGLVSETGHVVAKVISEYARSWSLLQGYDEQVLAEIGTRQNDMHALDPDSATDAIQELRRTLIAKGEATELFGQVRGNGLSSALATIEQGFADELFYPNVASRAAHLLYFVIKNHPLADGNKRSGSFLFLWYLRLNQHLLAKPVEQLINDNTLVALALLVAESLPNQKELMIRLIEHFILLKETSG